MYLNVISKRSYKVLFQRIYFALSPNPDRESRRNLQEVLQKPERRGCRRIVTFVLCIPVVFYLYLLLPTMPRHSVELPAPSPLTAPDIETTTRLNALEKVIDNKAIGKLYHNGPKAPITKPKEAYLLLRKPKAKFRRRTVKDLEYSTFVADVIDNTTSSTTTTQKFRYFNLPECVYNVSGSEKVLLNTSIVKVALDQVYPMVQQGGYYKPPDCWTKHKLAVLVPYRNRTRNLTTFLYNIHPFLMNQKLEYRIFVIEQFSNFNEFNKGRLFNAGFKEMKKFGEWRCVVLHDVDLLPTSARILYTCPLHPRHLSSSIVHLDSWKNTSSPILFGGVTMMTPEHYEKANGHSNLYWGWGGEDYDMFWRLRAAGIPVVRYNKSVAKFLALPHSQARVNPARYRLLHRAVDRWQDEGLSSLQYQVVATTSRHLFTHILVDINPLREIF